MFFQKTSSYELKKNFNVYKRCLFGRGKKHRKFLNCFTSKPFFLF